MAKTKVVSRKTVNFGNGKLIIKSTITEDTKRKIYSLHISPISGKLHQAGTYTSRDGKIVNVDKTVTTSLLFTNRIVLPQMIKNEGATAQNRIIWNDLDYLKIQQKMYLDLLKEFVDNFYGFIEDPQLRRITELETRLLEMEARLEKFNGIINSVHAVISPALYPGDFE